MGDILFLAHRVPYPPDRGDKIRSFHILRHLAARRRVHVVAFADDARDLATSEAVAAMAGGAKIILRRKPRALALSQALLTGKPISLTAFDDAALRTAVAEVLAANDIETIYVFSSQMAQYLPDSTDQRVVMDFVDMDSAKFAAYAEASRGPMRWLMRREAGKLGTYERAVAANAEASLFVSDAEADLFREQTAARSVHAIENGIDTAHYDPSLDYEHIDQPGPLIVFTGQMDYRPNIEGVTWFADAVLPRILERHPSARFAIVGRRPSDAVQALSRNPNVIVTGEVADVRGWLATAAVVVAPLKLARGIQNKVLEAMAMARSVVASGAAAEGIDHAGSIRVGVDAEAMAADVIALLDDPASAKVLGEKARARVIERYGWEARLAPLDALLGIETPAPARRSAA